MKSFLFSRGSALVVIGLALGACSTVTPQSHDQGHVTLVASADPPQAPAAETPATEKPSAGKPAGGKVSKEDLNKKSQNPIASLISLPLQNNTNFGVGPNDRTTNVLNVQPVIPFALSDEWNLIVRDVTPVIYMPSGTIPDSGSTFGLGDSLVTGFFSPNDSGDFTWGVGPAIQVPTSTREELDLGGWGAGPSAVAVWMPGKWVMGGVVNNVWSFDSDVNHGIFNPFLNYNLPDAWALTTAPILTVDWKADSGQQWTVPLGGGISKLVKIGKQPVVFSLAGYYNVIHPDEAARWSIQLMVKFLFPK